MIRKWLACALMVMIGSGCGTQGEQEITQNEAVEVSVELNGGKEETASETAVAVGSEAQENLTQSAGVNAQDISQSNEDGAGITASEAVAEAVDIETVTGAGDEKISREPAIQYEETKALWLSYLDLMEVFQAGGEEAYRAYMSQVINDMDGMGMNTLIYQVRPFGDALYESDLFPTSYVITGVEGDELAYDPFGIAVEMAHERGIRIEAWINPYRIRSANSDVPLCDDNLAKAWYEDGVRRVLKSDSGTLVYNPSSYDVQIRIVDGVKEILDRYPVDGIHFDDYFYPTTDLSFDEIDYMSYYLINNEFTQEEWRRENVNYLIKAVYDAVQEDGRGVVFGISPNGDIESNFSTYYADVELWLSEPGYVDYLMPQIYYGFEHSKYPYSDVLDQWYAIDDSGISIIPGLAVYKVGTSDQWAGDGSEEWISHEGIIADMIEDAKSEQGYTGYALYRYSFLFQPEADFSERMATERNAILEMQETSGF